MASEGALKAERQEREVASWAPFICAPRKERALYYPPQDGVRLLCSRICLLCWLLPGSSR